VSARSELASQRAWAAAYAARLVSAAPQEIAEAALAGAARDEDIRKLARWVLSVRAPPADQPPRSWTRECDDPMEKQPYRLVLEDDGLGLVELYEETGGRRSVVIGPKFILDESEVVWLHDALGRLLDARRARTLVVLDEEKP